MQATVKYAPNGKTYPSKYNDLLRIKAVIQTENGEEITLWRNEGDPILSRLQTGQTLQVFRDERDNYRIDPDTIAATPAPPFPTAPSAPPRASRPSRFQQPETSEKKELHDYIKMNASIYYTCFRELNKKFQNEDITEENLCHFTTSLFIHLTRKLS